MAYRLKVDWTCAYLDCDESGETSKLDELPQGWRWHPYECWTDVGKQVVNVGICPKH